MKCNKKNMNTIKKFLMSVTSATLLFMSSIIPVNAEIDKEPLNNRETALTQSTVTEERTAVTGNVRIGSFTVIQNDLYDSIEVYKIANITWNNSKKLYNAAAWIAPIKTWYTSGAGTSTKYGSPATLKKQSIANQQKFYNGLFNKDVTGNVLTTEGYGMESFKYASYTNNTYNGTRDEDDYGNAVTDESWAKSYTSGSPVMISHQIGTDVYLTAENYSDEGYTPVQACDVIIDGTIYASFAEEDELIAAGYNPAGGTTTITQASGETETQVQKTYTVNKENSYKKVTVTVDSGNQEVTDISYAKMGDLIRQVPSTWVVSNLEFGMYVVVASSKALKYAPVVVAVAPEKTPPEGTWYYTGNVQASLKGGDVLIDKMINGKDADIVEIGEKVTFSVTTSFPLSYKDRVILSKNSTSSVKNYTLTFNDDMSDAFNVDPTTFHLYYRENEDGDWVEFDNYKNIDYYALADSTYVGTKEQITSSWTDEQVKAKLYDKVITNTQLQTYKNGNYYVASLNDDVFTYLIASKSIDKDPNFSYADNRGGYGISVFACSTAAHKKYYQQYLFRYADKPNIYYWYYYRDGAYHLICIDDKATRYRTRYADEAEDGVINGEDANATQLAKTYAVNLTNSSSYLKNVRDYYKSITGDTVQHSVVYYPDEATSVFNITFNYNAVRDWMLDQENPTTHEKITNIAQIRVEYDATVTDSIEVNSDANTNTATLIYEQNATGTSVGTKEDTVFAYTYGLQLHKLDGDTNETLGGVDFKLYKEIDAFVDGTYFGSMEDRDYDSSLVNGLTLEAYKTSHASDGYYYYEYKAGNNEHLDAKYRITQYTNELGTTKRKATALASDTATAGKTVVRVFKPYVMKLGESNVYFDSTFESVASDDGYILKGLATGNYIIVETDPLETYNALAEDILFSLYPLDKDIANTVYGGQYKIFADVASGGTMETVQSEEGEEEQYQLTGITNANGLFEVTVLNYKGLTLPSTGGKGTLIFVIFGMSFMAAAIIFMLVQRKKNVQDYM